MATFTSTYRPPDWGGDSAEFRDEVIVRTAMNYLMLRLSLVGVLSTQLMLVPCDRAEPMFRGASSVLDSTDDTPDAAIIRTLEQRLEAAIVSGDITFLQTVFADDFRYTRTTGQIETKAQWLEDVAKRPFVARKIVSLDIEVHGDVAITDGQLDMTVRNEQGEHSNLVKYLRIYQRRNGQWQLLTHRSLEETAAKPIT